MNLRPIVVQLPARTHEMLLESAARRGMTASALAPGLLGAGLALLLDRETVRAEEVEMEEAAPALIHAAPAVREAAPERDGDHPPDPERPPATAAPVPTTRAEDLTKLQVRTIRSWRAGGRRDAWIAKTMELPLPTVKRVH